MADKFNMMKPSRFFSFICLLSCCFHLSHANEKLAQVDLKLVKNFIVFQAQIEDSRPLNFIFDAAAGPTAIDSTTAQELNLIFSKSAHVGTASRTIKVKNSDEYDLIVGGVVVGMDLVSIDLDHLSKYLEIRIDGILGVDLLKAYVVETNIDSGCMNLYRQERYNYQGFGQVMALTKLSSNHLGLACAVSLRKGLEKQLMLKIDTAYPDFVILSPKGMTVMEVNYATINKRKKVRGFGADDTMTTNLRGKIQSFKIGEWQWKKLPVIFTVDHLSVSATRSNETDGIIGQGLLLDFNIIYDWSRSFAYFSKRN